MKTIEIEQLAAVTGGRRTGRPVDTSVAQPTTQPKPVGSVGGPSPVTDTVLGRQKTPTPGLPVFVPFGAQKNHGGAASF